MPYFFGLGPNNSQPVSSLLYNLHIPDAMQSQQGPEIPVICDQGMCATGPAKLPKKVTMRCVFGTCAQFFLILRSPLEQLIF